MAVMVVMMSTIPAATQLGIYSKSHLFSHTIPLWNNAEQLRAVEAMLEVEGAEKGSSPGSIQTYYEPDFT